MKWCLLHVIAWLITMVTAQPGASDYVCFDLFFLFDVSCSISLEDQQRSIDFSKRLVEKLMIDDKSGLTVRVGAALFHGDVDKAFYLNDATEDTEEILILLDNIPNIRKAASVKCDTNTHLAIASLYEKYFTIEHGDRRDLAEYPNVAIMFSDARTILRKYAKPGQKLDQALTKCEQEGISVNLVLLKNNRTSGGVTKPPLDHMMITGNDPERLFNIREGVAAEEAQMDRLVAKLSSNKCVIRDDPNAPRPCADIIFAFDVSCSIDKSVKEAVKYVAAETYKKLFVNGVSMSISLIVFDRGTRSLLTFNASRDDNNLNQVMTDIADVNMTAVNCRTMTPEMFREVKTKHLPADFRKDAPNYLVLFYDGMTSPLNKRNLTLQMANDLKADLDIFLVKLQNNRGKLGDPEYNNIPSSPKGPDMYYTLPHDTDAIGEYLTDENKDKVVEELWPQLARFQCEV